MYRIKQLPEDFIVDEITSIKPENEGIYCYFTLEKRDYSTLKACQLIAKFLKIPLKHIGFAGSKDRHAITKQLISIKAPRKRIGEFKHSNIKLAFFGYGNKPISLGDLEGNRFEIIARNIDEKLKKLKKKPEPIKRILNLFGEQRFSQNNEKIGRLLVKKQFKEACELIGDDANSVAAEYLEQKQNDYTGALRKLPRKLLMMYLHAYQSFIFNKTAEEYVDIMKNKGKNIDEIENTAVPFAGFDIEYGNEYEKRKINENDEIKKIMQRIMQKENITERDFIIRELPNLSLEGGKRDLFAEVKDLKIGNLEDDELNKGKKKCRVSFALDRGCYGTEVVKSLFQ